MTDETLHPVVQLILARMKSNPEEFEDKGYGRWQYALDAIMDHGSEEEIRALREATRAIRLEEAHVWAMDELCNGDERRNPATVAYPTSLEQALTGYAQLGSAQNAYANSPNLLNSAQNVYANAAATTATPPPTLKLSNIHVNSDPTYIKMGKETLDERTLARIKRKLRW